MKNGLRLIRRFVGILLLSGFLLLIFNFILLIVISRDSTAGGSPWSAASEVAASLTQTEAGYAVSDAMSRQLAEKDVWAILIHNPTGKVIWHTDNLPGVIPMQYSIADVARLSRGYVKDYPTFTGAYNDGVVVLGFPKTSYWKAIYNNWDYSFIANLPGTVLLVILGNVAVIFLIYMVANTRLLKSVGPILKGIEALPAENDVHVRETGMLSEIAQYINKTSEALQTKNHKLKQKETARANWIAGVSHDIRTPLSMVMGYAGQLENDPVLPREAREKAAVICAQSVRMKNLIDDLNLASKLEYNMQPIHAGPFNAVSAVRQVVADFVNADIPSRFPVEWSIDGNLASCAVIGDAALFKRAVMNLLHNSKRHNPNGCRIWVGIMKRNDQCVVCVDDDGRGVDDAQLERIRNAPHSMVCDHQVPEQRHGLGLLLVKQIVAAHAGTVQFAHSPHGGFSAVVAIPVAAAADCAGVC